MSKYENACEFLGKADYEGGLPDLVLGYGVSPDEVPSSVADAIGELVAAYGRLEATVKRWHEESCTGTVDYEGEPQRCPW